MKTILTFLILFFAITTYCQKEENNSALNLNFEITENGLPTNWYVFGNSNYTISLDSINVKNGKYSTLIEFNKREIGFKALGFIIPENYPGKKITLTGYIKTKNVKNGYAGLWMRIDPSISYNDMREKGIKGTTDWTKYEITLDMDFEETEQIIIGGILFGQGKVWLDDFKVTIDGKDIKDLKSYEKEPLLADEDKEFDNGSGITNISLNKSQIENLKTLGLIWGFLKYYHPNIAKGEYNWDYELFRILPKVLNSKNQIDRDKILVNWIENLGEYSDGKEEEKSLKTKLEPDLDWINNSNFSEELTSSLLKVKNANRTKRHYYIEVPSGVNNTDFKNENAYSSMKYPDSGFRLLSLYRYWNIVQYFFPYKNLIQDDWKNVLEEFIPKIINANNEKEYTLTVLELIGRINDTHAKILGSNQVLDNYFGQRYAPIELTFIENEPIVTGYYDVDLGEETGLIIGDIITSINNTPVEEIIKEMLKYTPASNYSTKLRDIAPNLLRTNDSILEIEFIRNNEKVNKTINTFYSQEISISNKYYVHDTCFKLINKKIAYINNGSLKIKYLPLIWKEIKNTKGLIIDIRNYPSDYPISDLCNYLLPQSIPFVKFTKGSIETPGQFTFTTSFNVGIENKSNYKGKVVILINEITQSSAEYHAMAYQTHPNATIIGSTTAGADGITSKFYLPGGIQTLITGTGVYYSDEKETQRIGIVPDIEIKPTIQGIREGRDELLEKAIEIIQQ